METEGRVGWMGAKLQGPANHTPSSLAITSPNAPPGSQAPLWNVLDLFLTLRISIHPSKLCGSTVSESPGRGSVIPSPHTPCRHAQENTQNCGLILLHGPAS